MDVLFDMLVFGVAGYVVWGYIDWLTILVGR